MTILDGAELQQLMKQINSGGLMAPRADFRPELFDTAIIQKGYRVLWEQGMFCSCNNMESGQPDYNCPSCGGKGYVYFAPKEIRAITTSINGHKDQQRIGLDEMGSAYLTAPSMYEIGFRDRFTFLDFTTKFSEVVVRDEDYLSVMEDDLRYPAKDVISVRVLGTEYKRGLHFDLSNDGKQIIWKDYHIPQGDQYSVLYTTNPVYIAIGPIHELRGTYSMMKSGGIEAFHQLPKQFQIKREDFLDE